MGQFTPPSNHGKSPANQAPSPAATAPSKQKICATCGVIGEPKGFGCSEMIVMLILFAMMILPGILYAVYVDSQAKSCKACGAKTLVPLDSPKGRELAAKVK